MVLLHTLFRPPRRFFAAVLGTAAFLFLVHALWLPAKAVLAQALLERAWERQLAGAPTARPWPWADTHPVAALEIPSLSLRQLVLEGASSRNLAFGPTALTDIASADLLLAGHRDTHFSALRELRPGALIRLTRLTGVREFRVETLEVVDSKGLELVLEPDRERLTLLTCWPFDAAQAGGSLRMVVTALPLDGGPENSGAGDLAAHGRNGGGVVAAAENG